VLDAKKVAPVGQSPRCTVVLGMGGTIAGRALCAGDTVGYVAGQVPVSELLEGIPAAQGLWVEAEQVAQIDSKDMRHSHWLALADRVAHHLARDDVQAVVITHGTDTAEETAFFLQTVLRPSKPVVIAVAMRPVSALAPDGPQNLNDALCVAQLPGAHGVVLVCAGWVHLAHDVAKVHATDLNAFDSGDAGALGRVVHHQVVCFRPWSQLGLATAGAGALGLLRAAGRWPRVEVVMSHTDSDGALVGALLAQRALGAYVLDGLVVAGTGNGTVHEGLQSALLQAQAQGVRVVVSSRCAFGRHVDTEGAEKPASVSLSPVKARVALMLDLLGLSD
jgi:L-asparaginase